VQRPELHGRQVEDHPGPVLGVVADGDPLAVRQRDLDLGYPVRVPELLGRPHLGQALRLLAARGRLVEVGQFLAELDRLAVFEADFHPHLRPAAVCGGQLAVRHHPLDGGPVKQEFLPLGLGQLITVIVVVEQIERSSGGFLAQQYSRRLAAFLALSARVRL
jgi:hypothetical protein